MTLLFSGFVKAVDPLGSQYKLQDYLAAITDAYNKGFIHDWGTLIAAVLLAAFEFMLGIYLLFAISRKATSVIATLFMTVMTLTTVWIFIANPVSDCGCFGDAIVLSNGATLLKNIVLLALCGVIAWKPALMKRLISKKTSWIVSNYSALFILGISVYALANLPILDFRPYRSGANIPQLMDVPNDAPMYEEPPIHDFYLTYKDEDITDEILADSVYTFLLVAPHLETADDTQFGNINMIADYAKRMNYRFLCLTASGEEAQEHWADITGAEYEYANCDDIPLKTMVRSSPGLVLMKEGVIYQKWSHNFLPKLDESSPELEKTPYGKIAEEQEKDKLLKALAWYLIPLLLLTFLDRLVNGISAIFRKHKNRGKNEENQNTNPNINTKKVMRKKIVAGNWKMNMNLQEGIDLVKEVVANNAAKPNCDVIVCTPFIHLATVAPMMNENVALGAENCADKAKGAYTGEVSAEMVKSTGAQYVILGHSERREYYNETPEILKEKVDLALANGLKILFCIGESLEQREANQQNEVCKAELEGSVFHLTAEQFANIVIAYEPIWAIGTGKTATSDQAEEIHAFIRSVVAEKYGQEVADNTSILYGGSCKASNAPELFAKPDIDGGLIGGASLKAADFQGIIDAWK